MMKTLLIYIPNELWVVMIVGCVAEYEFLMWIDEIRKEIPSDT
jgi:hypothetical protein